MGGRLYGLDALRGVAALSVLGFHLWTVFDVLPWFSRAYLAVDFFFMLSGFVMARTYEGRFPELSTAKFFAIRFRRLWGTMAAGTAIGIVFFLSIGTSPALVGAAALTGLLFVPFFLTVQPFMLNRPEWSIFFELIANMLHAALLWRLKTLHLLVVAMSCLAVSTIYDNGYFLAGNITPNFVGGFPRVILSYSLGIVIWRERWLLKVPLWLACVSLPLSLIALPLVSIPLDFVFVVAVCPALIMIGARPVHGGWGRLLGDMSFPLYAVHYPVLQIAHWLDLGPVPGAAVSIALAAAMTMPLRRRGARAPAFS